MIGIKKKLIAVQYERNDIDFSRGCFRVRGDLVEVFPAHEDSNVIRVEFLVMTIETIAICDVKGQGFRKDRKCDDLSKVSLCCK